MPAKPVLIWSAVAAILAVPVGAALLSPLLAWRDPVYILAGLAGVLGLAALVLQPLLAANLLPGPAPLTARRLHRAVGAALVLLIVVHVGGLWITSPPDVIDALLLRSPTPFSLWGVIAMWGVLATAGLAIRRRHLRPRLWRLLHAGLAVVIVATTVLHAMLIQGTMETVTKAILCLAAVLATGKALCCLRLRVRPGKARPPSG